MPFLSLSDNLLQDCFFFKKKKVLTIMRYRTKHAQFWFGMQFPLLYNLKLTVMLVQSYRCEISLCACTPQNIVSDSIQENMQVLSRPPWNCTEFIVPFIIYSLWFGDMMTVGRYKTSIILDGEREDIPVIWVMENVLICCTKYELEKKKKRLEGTIFGGFDSVN